MAHGRSTDRRRAPAMLLVGIFLSAGCGSATGQVAQTSTAVPAAQTDKTAGLPSAGSRSIRSADSSSIRSAGSRSIRSADSGIAGVTVAIVCGGPASEQGCPRRPVPATIDVLRMPSRRHIATVPTDSQGRFRFTAAPGTYELRAHTSSQSVWARVVTARVLPHQVKRTTIIFVPRGPLPIAPASASG
jgi:hypothetical protein